MFTVSDFGNHKNKPTEFDNKKVVTQIDYTLRTESTCMLAANLKPLNRH